MIKTRQLTVRDGAVVAVSSRSKDSNEGAGTLEVMAQTIRLDNQGAIAAETASGNGGDITLQNLDLLLLRHKSQISTTAGTAQAGGNGGNITIAADLIVAIPEENSDITANAFTGIGGKIEITTAGIFGLVQRDLADLKTLLEPEDPLDPDRLPSSDITASSRFGVEGVININAPDVDPSQGLVELPTDIVDVAGLIEQKLCTAGQGSEFTATGRGGLPESPKEALSPDTTWEDWRLAGSNEQPVGAQPSVVTPERSRTENNTPKRIVEAQDWIIAPNGNVLLTAEPVRVTPHGIWLHPLDCQQLKASLSAHSSKGRE